NRGLGLLLRKRFCRSFDFELQAAASDDSIVLSLGLQHAFPLTDMLDFLAPIQRMETDDITAAVFPSLAACQDNATGPREIPDHPLVRQTLHDCMNEA